MSTEAAHRGLVDVHAHWYPEECLDRLVRATPVLSLRSDASGTQVLFRGSVATTLSPDALDIAERIRVLDALGIQTQVLSFGALDVGWSGFDAAGIARSVNEALAEISHGSSGRFRFLAVLPLADRRAMVEELDRALALGALGVATTTTYGGQPLDAPAFGWFWREASEREVPVFIHPCYSPLGPREDAGTYLLAGFLGETALAATRLIMSGVLEKHRGVAIVWSHLGGSLPLLGSRLDAARSRFPRCRQKPSDLLRECYYDTVCTQGSALDCAADAFGRDRLMFGTDEPHRLEQPEAILLALRERTWTPEELDAVVRGTATRLLKLSPTTAWTSHAPD